MTVSEHLYKRLTVILIHTSVKLVTGAAHLAALIKGHFNPHEREARDFALYIEPLIAPILIHTSVKLVTTIFFLSPSSALF